MKKTTVLLIPLALMGLAFVWYQSPIGTGKAEDNYKEYCASCHGENLKTFVNRKWIYGNSWNEVFYAIKEGYPDDGMPGYDTTFTDREISDLVNYILGGIEDLEIQNFDQKDNESLSGVIKSEDLSFRLDTVVTGMKVPWGIAFLPNGDLLVTDRNGAFYRQSEGKPKQQIKGAPEVLAKGQGGLLDVEVHPDFENNQTIYLSYSKPNKDRSKSTTAVMMAILNGNELKNQKDIFVAEPYLSTRHHYGSRLEFDNNGYLYLSVGDRGRRDQNPQSLNNHCGKIHRIHADGSIPEDNPFVDQKNAIASIYSYGHRNPQGVTLDPSTNIIWEHEHGPRGGDEVNLIQAGKNYGWPIISYGINYNGTKFTDITEKDGMQQPEYYWVPSIGACGLAFVSGDRYPGWEGDLLAGSLRFQYLERVKIKDNKVVGKEKLLKNIGRLRDVKMGRDGYIYFSVEDPGMVLRIVPVD